MIDPEWTTAVHEAVDWLANWYIIGSKNSWYLQRPEYDFLLTALFIGLVVQCLLYRLGKMKVLEHDMGRTLNGDYDWSPNQNYVDTQVLTLPPLPVMNVNEEHLWPDDLVVMICKGTDEPTTVMVPLRAVRGNRRRRYDGREDTTIRLSNAAVSRIRRVSRAG